jgi:hypothetical protein
MHVSFLAGLFSLALVIVVTERYIRFVSIQAARKQKSRELLPQG